jgi:hypothetical protein
LGASDRHRPEDSDRGGQRDGERANPYARVAELVDGEFCGSAIKKPLLHPIEQLHK